VAQVTGMIGLLLVAGCTALTRQVLVDEKAQPVPAGATTHCSGSEWMDNSMMAVVPIPIIGLGMPTQEINEIKSDDVLSKCGPPDRLLNRHVEVDRTACVPTVLTRVISFGVWQWCPASVSYQADVKQPEPPRTAEVPQPEPPASSGATSGTRYPYAGNRPSYLTQDR
jgi:hypothetical protein